MSVNVASLNVSKGLIALSSNPSSVSMLNRSAFIPPAIYLCCTGDIVVISSQRLEVLPSYGAHIQNYRDCKGKQ